MLRLHNTHRRACGAASGKIGTGSGSLTRHEGYRYTTTLRWHEGGRVCAAARIKAHHAEAAHCPDALPPSGPCLPPR